jgi:hypothetical protein
MTQTEGRSSSIKSSMAGDYFDKNYILDRVDELGEKGCWIWAKSKNEWGYGTCGYNRGGVRITSQLAHRVAYEVFNGPIGEMCVLHKCDNPACVNPWHLWLGTNYDNVLDRHSKGRSGGGAQWHKKNK